MTDLVTASPGLRAWLRARRIWRPMWQPEDSLALLVDGQHRLELTLVQGSAIVARIPLAALPADGHVLASLLTRLLEVLGPHLAATPGALAIDPAGRHVWWQTCFACRGPEEQIDDTLETFLALLPALQQAAGEHCQ